MNRLEATERAALTILLIAALLTFFFPVISVHLPILGDQSWSGYDALTKLNGLDKQLSSIQPPASNEENPQAEQSPSEPQPATPPMPASVRLIVFVPIEIALAFGCVLIVLLCNLGSSMAYRIRPVSIIGGIAAVLALLHLTIINSDLHSWFQASLLSAQSDAKDNPFAGLTRQIGSLVANSVQIKAGTGLFALAGFLILAAFLAYSRLLKRGHEPDLTEDSPQQDSRVTLFFATMGIGIVIMAVALFEATHTNPSSSPVAPKTSPSDGIRPTVNAQQEQQNSAPTALNPDAASSQVDGQDDSVQSEGSGEPVISIGAHSIIKAFEEDVVSANDRFRNRKITVTGVLSRVVTPSEEMSDRMAKNGTEAETIATMDDPAVGGKGVLLLGVSTHANNASLSGQPYNVLYESSRQNSVAVANEMKVGETVTIICRGVEDYVQESDSVIFWDCNLLDGSPSN